MKKLLPLIFLLSFSINTYSQLPQLQVGVTVNVLIESFTQTVTGACINNPPYYFFKYIEVAWNINPPPQGTNWILVIDSLNTYPGSAYTLETTTIHNHDTLPMNLSYPYYTIRMDSVGYIRTRLLLVGTPTQAGEVYWCHFAGSGGGGQCSDLDTYGSNPLSQCTVLGPASVSQAEYLSNYNIIYYETLHSILISNNYSKAFDFTLFNSTGQKILSKTINVQTDIIPLNNLSKGVYFWQMRSQSKTESNKIIID
jgi:hypothetical protein